MNAYRPDARTLALQRRAAEYARMAHMAHKARWVNWAAVVFCVLISFDWALPLQQFPDEPVLERRPVSVASTLSNPQMVYRIRTPHTSFRLHPNQTYRLRDASRLTVWRSPLLHVVRLVKAPSVPAGREPFAPYGGNIYNSALAVFPALLLLVASLGLLLPFPPETKLNTSIVGGLLWLVTLAVMILF
ncbi:hypothetical protein [Hymenobacter metallilatus]|uniref:Uncharacterized protein n=1 Tax=Hymenobacter metallilatus TaxID=2493666 RepID=A0A428JJZ1_9BACT|nr:hypothetical protein [Hymenobacter metallilatus]RSK33060.1 hypothetical protein EI290_10100 [Hymenobacter metallilatus]